MRALLAVVLLAAAPGWAGPGDAQERLVVGLDSILEPDLVRALEARGAAVLHAPPGAPWAVVAASRAALQEWGRARYVEPDPALFLEEEPNDLHWGQVGPWPGQWGPPAIGAPAAWDVTWGSEEVVVAVLDTGVDYLHPELAEAVWRNEDEVAGNGLDDDGNGYVDDVVGWDCADHDNDPRGSTAQFHGTHVAGIVGARADNRVGIAGLAQVRIMALKVFGMESVASAAAECIRYAVDNGARILGMSWGSGPSTVLDETIREAWDGGAILVKSAGNAFGGPVTYPGTLPEVIAVSALDPPGTVLAPYSSTGAKVELAAPGTDILSTLSLGSAYVGLAPPPPLLAYLNGTSMAQPHVAGVAALVLSRNPALTNQEVRDILGATADDLGAPGRDPQFGFGRVNAHAAVVAAGP